MLVRPELRCDPSVRARAAGIDFVDGADAETPEPERDLAVAVGGCPVASDTWVPDQRGRMTMCTVTRRWAEPVEHQRAGVESEAEHACRLSSAEALSCLRFRVHFQSA
jgi:hypothetical protein